MVENQITDVVLRTLRSLMGPPPVNGITGYIRTDQDIKELKFSLRSDQSETVNDVQPIVKIKRISWRIAPLSGRDT